MLLSKEVMAQNPSEKSDILMSNRSFPYSQHSMLTMSTISFYNFQNVISVSEVLIQTFQASEGLLRLSYVFSLPLF